MNTRAKLRSVMMAACLLGLAAPAHAQFSLDVRSGDWVQVETVQRGRVQGKLIKVDNNSVILATRESSTDSLVLPRSAVTSLWVSVDRKRQTRRGIIFGVGAGAAIGAIWAALTYEPCEEPPDDPFACIFESESAGEEATLGAISGGLVGLVIGGVAGYSMKRHVWEAARMPASLGFAPVRNGGVALSLRWRI